MDVHDPNGSNSSGGMVVNSQNQQSLCSQIMQSVTMIVSIVVLALVISNGDDDGTTITVGSDGGSSGQAYQQSSGSGGALQVSLSGGSSGSSGGGRDEYLQDRETVLIGFDTTWPPYCFSTNDDKGTPDKQVGFLADSVMIACKNAKLNCELVTMDFLDCWAANHHAGNGLQNQWYDMCLCWTDTHARRREVIYPTTFTKPNMGGLLMMNSKVDTFGDDSDDTTIKILCPKSGKCSDNTVSKTSDKIKIGIIQGWATSIAAFDYMTFKGRGFNKDNIIFVDEKGDGKGDIKTVNHIAQELESGAIDMAFMYQTAVEDHKNDKCTICKDHDAWKDGTFAMKFKGLEFAASGASGFLRKDRTQLRDKISAGIEMFKKDRTAYCQLCFKYFPSKTSCNANCEDCDSVCAGGSS